MLRKTFSPAPHLVCIKRFPCLGFFPKVKSNDELGTEKQQGNDSGDRQLGEGDPTERCSEVEGGSRHRVGWLETGLAMMEALRPLPFSLYCSHSGLGSRTGGPWRPGP